MLNHLKASYSFSSHQSTDRMPCDDSKAKMESTKKNHLRVVKEDKASKAETQPSYDFVGVAG